MSEDRFVLSPSLLSSDFSRLQQELTDLEEAGLPWVHWDVMDGHFVPNITLGPMIIKKCRDKSGLFFDVHLMIERPDEYLEDFATAGADLICVHAEATSHLERTVSRIRELGAKPAVALNPHTPLCQVEYLLPQLDMVLIMSVNPGFSGQQFIPFAIKKVRDLKKMIQDQGGTTLIQVDGGVDLSNAGKLTASGADVLVSGSAFFRNPPYRQRYQQFRETVRAGRRG
ncbi:MAG: ribulose-phosphate 3-epimerase [Desulfohalobiaceae bacterium]|nr:ribulose-phosphate 3-epimerase [Desulfohalobiaceae bacterium]